MLANYLLAANRPLSLQELSACTQGEHAEEFWVELTGKDATNRGQKEQWDARPAYFERLRRTLMPPANLVKSHTPNSDWFGSPAFSFLPGDRIIHIVRHPCAVAVSCAAFYGDTHQVAVEYLLTDYLTRTGQPHHGHEFIGSWSQHTRSWMKAVNVPLMRIRYDELVAQPQVLLGRLIAFLGQEVNHRHIEFAVAASGFTLLKALEDAHGFPEAPPGRTFFREGNPHGWETGLDAALQKRILATLGDLMSVLGFSGPRATGRRTTVSPHASRQGIRLS
jgi:Sulfotransferase domain